MKEEKLYRRYTVRLFPTPEQEELMWKHVHAARFIWNYMLALQESRLKNGRKRLSGFKMIGELSLMTKQCEFEWLKDVCKHSLGEVCRDLDKSFSAYFDWKCEFPKFKTKKSARYKNNFPIRGEKSTSYFKEQNVFVMPKIGHIKCSNNYNVPVGFERNGENLIKNPRVQYIKSSQKWILTFVMTFEKQEKKLTDKSMGIDLGIKELAVVAVGDKKLVFHNINKSKRMKALEKKKKHIRRAISRKYEANESWEKSKSIEKYEQILREIDSKMANIRHNYIHQITRELVSIFPERVVMEDLNVRGMLKNKHLSKSISEQNFYFFIQTMKYKCEEYGIEFVQTDRFYPSSKTCSNCGHKKKDLKLKDRTYICPVCGLEIDRDYNAAINLMNYTENTTSALVSTQKCGNALVA